MRSRRTGLAAALLLAACSARSTPSVGDRTTLPPPDMVVGAFQDDYGIRYQIGRDEWLQLPRGRYRVVAWFPAEQYLIARNDSTNREDGGRYTRIDWMSLAAIPGMAPYEWAFCLTAWKEPTAAAAGAVTTARRDAPKTGCGGFPFSRMKRIPGAPPAGRP